MRNLVFVVAAVCVAGEARADELQTRILAAARATRPDAYSFRRTIAAEQTGSARRLRVEHYDPRRPLADRWSLVSVDGRAPNEKEASRARKAERGPVPSYAEVAKWIGAPATRTDTAPGQVTYHYPRLPAGTLKIGSHDASADTQAEAVVNTRGRTPFVERVRFTSTRKFRMMMVASVQSMVFTARYALLPSGQAVPAEIGSTIAGSLMGKSGQMRMTASFADVQAVR